MITILDYGSGNVSAFANIFKRANIDYKIASKVEDLAGVEKIILPGVGAFDTVVQNLNDSGMRQELNVLVLDKKVPILGVCVGMQIMANDSDEGDLEGLSWIEGSVKAIDGTQLQHKPKTPHMGWNSIKFQQEDPIFASVDPEKGYYFLHSYHYDVANRDNILATMDYGQELVCAIKKDNVYGFQFHPEKSHSNGINLLINFARM